MDVGVVQASAMMPGSSRIFGVVGVGSTDTPGRYLTTTDLGTAGEWQLIVKWDGPAGQDSVTFSPRVQ